jgi:hypothetical protein
VAFICWSLVGFKSHKIHSLEDSIALYTVSLQSNLAFRVECLDHDGTLLYEFAQASSLSAIRHSKSGHEHDQTDSSQNVGLYYDEQLSTVSTSQ